MEDNEKILNLLEKLVVGQDETNQRLTNLEMEVTGIKSELTVVKEKVAVIEKEISIINEKIDIIKEDAEITRAGTNQLLDWADRVEHKIKIPLMEFANNY